MRLAHPLRCDVESTGSIKMLKEFFGPKVWANMSKAFAEERLTSELVGELYDNPENQRLRAMLEASNHMEGGTEVGNAYATLLYLRQAMHPQPYFVVDDALVELLENTDIADDVPVSMVNLPFQRFYVEFGKERKCSLRLPNLASGLHILEGAYLERGTNSTMGEGIFVLLTGSPIGKSGEMDDATHSLFMPMDNPDRSVKDALALTFNKGRELSIQSGLRLTPDSFLDQTFEDVLFLVKTLLYIGLPEARKLLHKDKTEWQKSVNGLKSPGKKAKAERRGKGLVDHILVCAPAAAVGTSTESPGQRSVPSHWRRGHYRMQAHGVQYSLRRMIFIQPTLVHGDAGDTPVPQYRVK
jgi:hypothetical protein